MDLKNGLVFCAAATSTLFTVFENRQNCLIFQFLCQNEYCFMSLIFQKLEFFNSKM